MPVSTMSDKRKASPEHPIIQLKKEPLLLVCEWCDCDRSFYQMSDFIDHVKTVHLSQYQNATPDKCVWKDCGGTIVNNREFLRHTYFHVYHTKIKCIGQNLLLRNEMTCSLGALGRNVIPELPNDFACEWTNCKEEFSNPELFYRHVEAHAENTPKGNNPKGGVTCFWEGCHSHFQSQYRLRDHLHSHSQEKVVACPTCGAFFANRTKLLDHVRRQVTIQEIQCTHCSKCFSSERLLRDHMRNHVNHYKCPYCDMTCPSPSGLTTHIKYRHTDVKPFTCFLCDYSCKSQSDLRRHIDTHKPEAPTNKCCYSSCTFTSRNFQTLVNHVRKNHEGIKTGFYKCHICEKMFNRGSILSRHLIKQHKFQLPSGHSRFRYKCGDDGFYQLQTVRYESIDLMQIAEDSTEVEDATISMELSGVNEESAGDDSTRDGKNSCIQTGVISVPVVLNDTEKDVLISIEQAEDGSYVMQTVVPSAQNS